jgi:hypothetical protein
MHVLRLASDVKSAWWYKDHMFNIIDIWVTKIQNVSIGPC